MRRAVTTGVAAADRTAAAIPPTMQQRAAEVTWQIHTLASGVWASADSDQAHNGLSRLCCVTIRKPAVEVQYEAYGAVAGDSALAQQLGIH